MLRITVSNAQTGEVYDTEDISNEEFWNMSAIGAFALLREMSIPQED